MSEDLGLRTTLSVVLMARCSMLGMQTHTKKKQKKHSGLHARNTNHSTRQPYRRQGNSLTTGCHGDLPERSIGWGAIGGGVVYGHRIVSVARSARHVALGAVSCLVKIDGANNQLS